jgi:riboflavin kinase, archaea type
MTGRFALGDRSGSRFWTRKVVVVGTVKRGWGSSSRQKDVYIDPIRERTGVSVYPGSLNLDICTELYFCNGMKVRTSLGAYLLYPVTVNGLQAFAVKPPRAKNRPNTLELMSPTALRDHLGLANGDKVRIEILSRYIRPTRAGRWRSFMRRVLGRLARLVR